MSDDPIREIQFTKTESVYSVQKPSSKPFHKNKKEKEYKSKRGKDIVELSDELSLEKASREKQQDANLVNEKLMDENISNSLQKNTTKSSIHIDIFVN